MAAALAPFPTVYGANGMVCAVDHLAAGAGVAMLREGGSAVDAAVAASAVLAVTSQHLCGMGGDLFALLYRGGEVSALNASGPAGSGADPARLRSEGRHTMPARGDVRSVPVPGCVDGWLALHSRFGRLALSRVLEPARAYAEHGFPASPTLAASVPAVAGLPGARDYTAPGAGALRPGQRVRRPGVAGALADVVAGGRDAFYRGEFGRGLLELGAGEYLEQDLSRPLACWVPPISLEAWGHRLWTVPPNSQGYLTLAGAWMASGLGLPADPDDPLWAHLLVEAARQAAYDRPLVLHEGADGAALIAPERLAPRRSAIEADHAARLGEAYAGGGTIAVVAVDGDRDGVALLQSNAAGWGAHLAVADVGIFLHNRGVGFSLEPGHPAEYGPGRRPPHTLAPVLVTRPDGSLHTVAATMGGDSQPQVLLQLLARTPQVGQAPGPAVAAGRWALSTRARTGADELPAIGFQTWRAGGEVTVRMEGHAPGPWAGALAARGHHVERTEEFDHGFGHAQLITVAGDHLAGASDPRARGGAAAAW
ncbi:MAG TPA: gamma-glutamyltransferase [Acidimicrobiales bacterium]|nr:gamma-glutamyltransferase [Acidimicrobiales bacterium]